MARQQAARPVRLRRLGRRERLVLNIREAVARGEIKPGERLASIKEFCELYSCSQRIVLAAMDILAREELVQRRRGSGYYVAPGAKAPTSLAVRPPPADGGAKTGDDLTYFYLPRPKARPLTLYVSDMFPAQLEAWQDCLAAFRRQHPRIEVAMLTPADGHLEDLLHQQRPLDVLHTTPQMVGALPADTVVTFRGLDAFGLAATDLHPCLRAVPPPGTATAGAPFSLTVHVLAMNEALAQTAWPGAKVPTPASLAAWLKRSAAFEQELAAREDVYGLNGYWPYSLLTAAGALRWRPGTRTTLDEPRLRGLLTQLAQARLRGKALEPDVVQPYELFKGGVLLWLSINSFMCSRLHELEFPVRVTSLPMGADGHFEAVLTQLSVHSRSAHKADCLELIRHLVGQESQRRYGESCANLPVRHDALFAPSVLARYPVSRQDLETTLKHAVPIWPDAAHHDPLISAANDALYALLQGRATVDATVSALIRLCA